MKGKFIVIEGLDGSGATSQINLLVDYLNSKKIKTFYTKEPTDNIIGGLIRGVLTGVYHLPDESLQLLFSADRGHHIQRVIKPILQKGQNVVCDRYIWSTIAFGSTTLDKKGLLGLQRYSLLPDLTIILKIKPEESLKRIKDNRFGFELFEEVKKLKKVWTTYEWLSMKYPKTIKVVNGEGTKKEISERIINEVNKFFKKSI